MQLVKGLLQSQSINSKLLLLMCSIIAFILAMPGSPLPLLTWVALVPIGLALINTTPRQSATLFYLCTVVCWLAAVGWLIPALMKFTQLNTLVAFIILLLLCLILALPYALIGWLISHQQWLHKPFGVFYISAAYTVVIAFFPSLLPGNHVHALYQQPIFLQVLAIGGVPLLLFVVVFVNWQLVKALSCFRGNPRSACFALFQAIAMLAVIMLYGFWQMNELEKSIQQEGEAIKVGMIQPKLQREDALDPLFVMSARMVAQDPSIDLLVWPEFPAAFSYLENPQDKKRVDQLIRLIKKPMLLVSGYNYETPPTTQNPTPEYYNTAQLIDQNHKLQGSYDKQILVPFFEYIPAEAYFPFLRKLFPGALHYVPGKQEQIFNFNDAINIIPLICYETVFPELTRQFVKQGGNIIFNLTNDIWFGDYWGSAYHFSLGIFRSIENRVPWIRATNSGISGVAKASGEIITETLTPQLETATRVFNVEIPPERSFYFHYGDIFLHMLMIILIFNLLKDVRLKRQERKRASSPF